MRTKLQYIIYQATMMCYLKIFHTNKEQVLYLMHVAKKKGICYQTL